VSGETLIEWLILFFIVGIAPVPWWLIAFHHVVQRHSRKMAIVSYASILLFWVVLGYVAVSHRDFIFGNHFTPTILTQAVGFIFIVLAGIVDWQVIKVLGVKRLLMFVEFNQEKTSDHFVESGIYKYARHPRYVEYMLISASIGLFFGYIFLFYYLAYLVLAFWIATAVEEQELVERFGDTYRNYRKRVPRFFIPL